MPIDLQTMFSQMSQVGKQQAVQRQVAPEAQALQASKLVKETEIRDNSVNESRDLEEGVEHVKEEEERQRRRRSGAKGGGEKQGRQASSEEELFADPDLGRHIDITG